MRSPVLAALTASFAVAACSAKTTGNAPRADADSAASLAPNVMADLVTDVSQVEEKLVSLAKAMPAEKYAWRPGKDVRSVGEVFQHVTSDNYLIPAMLGTPAPDSTGIKGEDFKTAEAYAQRKVTRDVVIADLQASFSHLKAAMQATPAARLGEQVSYFGQRSTLQQVWIGAATHLHEHLGQSIAYARSNGVVPPWSK
jgi:uncharacterized damage-inducible protein DinB